MNIFTDLDIEKLKIKLFTHGDNDGNGPVVLLKHFYPFAELSVTYCSTPDDTDRKVLEYLKNDNADVIYVTDTSVSEKVAEKLQKTGKARLFDHHKTALELNKFDFCSVVLEENNELTCGTKIFYNYLINEKNVETNETIDRFVKLVNDYDTWLWETKYHYKEPYELNTLFHFYGREKFTENMLEKFKKNDLSYNEFDKTILNVEEKNKNAYVWGKTREVFEREVMGKKCVIVFAERYINDIATKLAEMYPNSEVQTVIGPNSVSLRSRGNATDVSEIAKAFGGGGHPAAAGIPIKKENKTEYMDLLFKEDI